MLARQLCLSFCTCNWRWNGHPIGRRLCQEWLGAQYTGSSNRAGKGVSWVVTCFAVVDSTATLASTSQDRVLSLYMAAGVTRDYKPIPIPTSGCRPANSSLWVSFPDEPYMHRYASTGFNFMDHTTAAQLNGGFIWMPRTR
jgi:hypothetical protein